MISFRRNHSEALWTVFRKQLLCRLSNSGTAEEDGQVVLKGTPFVWLCCMAVALVGYDIPCRTAGASCR